MLHNNPIVAAEGYNRVASDTLGEEDADFLKYDGVVEQVQQWLKILVSKHDYFLSPTGIDGSVLANIIETAAGKIDSGLPSPAQPVLDVAVLRFPDLDHPYLTVYHLEISPYCDGSKTGLSGDFRCQSFIPRQQVLEHMNSTIRQKVIAEAQTLFA